jgi:hypothetical protein
MTDIETGMTGLQVRTALNSNFSTLFNDKTFISVKEYGAVGDGETDDNAAIKACIEAACGRTVYFPAGTYKSIGKINIITEYAVNIYGENSVIEVSGITSNGGAVIQISSAIGTANLLLADVAKGDYTITPTNPENFSEGDIIHIKDNVVLEEAEVYNGEMLHIFSITEGVVKLHSPVMGNYSTSENASISKLNNRPVTINGLNIVGTNDYIINGIMTYNRSNVSIYNNIVTKCTAGGIHAWNCLYGNIYSNEINDCYVSGLGYGIIIDSSKNINVYGNNVMECRHCIVTGGSYPCFQIEIHDNIVSSSTVVPPSGNGAISTHPHDYYIIIKDNIIFGDGIFVRSHSSTVAGNTIYVTEASQMGIYVLFSTMYNPSIIIESNNFIQLRDDVKGTVSMRLVAEENDVIIDNLVIQNNTTKGFTYDLNLFSSTYTGLVIANLVIKNNNFNGTDVINDFVSNNITVINAVIEGNVFKSPFNFVVTAITNLSFKNNRIIQSIAGKSFYTAIVTHAIVSDNVFDSNTDDECVTISNVTTLIFINNVIRNCTAVNATLLDTITNLINQGNSIDNCSNAISKVSITNDLSGTNFTY